MMEYIALILVGCIQYSGDWVNTNLFVKRFPGRMCKALMSERSPTVMDPASMCLKSVTRPKVGYLWKNVYSLVSTVVAVTVHAHNKVKASVPAQ